MKFGLSDEHLQFLIKTLAVPLKKEGITVFIFGSRARGKHHQFSDVDILIEGVMTPRLKNQIVNIKEIMEESNFPYKLDLVHIDDLASSYRESVLKDRLVLS